MVLEISNRLKHGGKDELPAATHEGTGLGLANVCQRLEARFGSRASCRFGPMTGGGYKVSLTMPVEIEWLKLNPLRVLIADDEPLAAERLQLLLARAEGAQLVGTASDGDSAINLTDALAPRRAAARHRHAGPRRDRRRARARGAETLARGRVRHRVRPVRGRGVRGRGGRLSDEAGRSGAAPARARPRPRLSRSSAARSRRPGKASQWLEEFWASDLSGLVRIAARDVDRVSAERDYMRLHVGRRSWLIHHSMAALEEGLDPELFVRLHRSAIVRKDFIAGFTRNPSGRWIARLADGTEQPVGRLYSDRVRAIAGR